MVLLSLLFPNIILKLMRKNEYPHRTNSHAFFFNYIEFPSSRKKFLFDVVLNVLSINVCLNKNKNT